MSKTTVLIVEDEEIVAADLASKLIQLGYEVVGTAARGKDAVETACRLHPQIVLMDIWLKGKMDGIDAAEAIRSQFDVPIIYLTAHSDTATLARAKITEPFGYILKPFEERELSTTIEMALYKHQSDRQLREQRELLRTTLTSIGDAVISCDTAGRVTFLNPIAEALTGWSAEEARGRQIQEVFLIINEQTRQTSEDPAALVLRDGRTKTLANHTALVSRNGREIPIEDSAAPILDADGRVIGVVLVFHDVTEKRRSHQTLLKSEEQLKRSQEIAHLGSWELDLATNELTWSDEVYRIFGLQPQEFGATYDAFLEAVHPGDRAKVDSAYSGSLREGKDSYEIEHRIIRKSTGEIRVVHEKCEHFRDSSGRIIRSAGMVHDVTDRIEAEEALKVSELRLAEIVRKSPSFVSILRGPDHVFELANDKYLQLIGHRDILGKKLMEALPEIADSPYPQVLDRVYQTGEPFTASDVSVMLARGANGKLEEVWVDFIYLPMREPDGTISGIFAHGVDITERKRAEEGLHMAKETAEAASRAKSQFLANMSHELRTPMTGVLGMLEFTLKTPLDAQQQDLIETAHKSARSLLRILNDILDLAKVETGKLSIEVKPFVLHDCVAGAVDILVPEARRKGLELICTMADDLPKTVAGDHVRLLQILTNLLGNAVKYTERGEVKIAVMAGPQTPAGKREFNFVITDTGIGIPADKKEMIFQSFTQADESHTRKFGGVGLGLAISRELVERMGGTISCESEEGIGSTFSFTIPFGDDQTKGEMASIPMAPSPVTAIPISTGMKEKARLLLAEDDPITRKVIGMMLQKSNFDIDIAENGLQAVEMWEKGNYDLILMDVQMPHMDGFAATSSIREKERENDGHTLIVAMTAHAFPEDEMRCRAAGMDAYISKPIDMKQCIELIEDLIAKREQGV